MRGRHHDLVGRERRGALEVQVLVGEEVDLELLHVEPVDEVRVGHELPRVVGLDLRPHVGDRPQPRRVADAAAVAVPRVEAQRPERAGPGAGVGEVAEGRDQQRDLRRRRLPLLRPDRERHVVLEAAAAQPRRVDPRLQRVRHAELEPHLPAGVVDVVVVEVDRAVLLPRLLVVHLERVPVVAGHGAHRQVHGPSVQPDRAGVGDAFRLDVGREVPGGEGSAALAAPA